MSWHALWREEMKIKSHWWMDDILDDGTNHPAIQGYPGLSSWYLVLFRKYLSSMNSSVFSKCEPSSSDDWVPLKSLWNRLKWLNNIVRMSGKNTWTFFLCLWRGVEIQQFRIQWRSSGICHLSTSIFPFPWCMAANMMVSFRALLSWMVHTVDGRNPMHKAS